MEEINLSNKRYNGETIAMFKRWLENRNAGKTFVDYFNEYGFGEIAIFDAGEIGRLLYDEIKESDIKVLCFIDRNAEGIKEIDGIPVLQIKDIDKLPDVDIVVTSPVYQYDAVVKMLVNINPKIRTIYMKDAVYEF
ncbi:MAG: hypothetical protein IJV15_11460 [Lachnospiraceae bacterium]|nr:hypothetical protein [Lachnospiraceae bacterium]